MKRGALFGMLLGGVIAVACSDDDDDSGLGTNTPGGGEAGGLDSPSPGGSPSASGAGGAGLAAAIAGEGGVGTANGGAGAAGAVAGGAGGFAAVAGDGAGGAAGDGAGGGAGAAGAAPTGSYIACPALGDKFELTPDDARNPDFTPNVENLALGEAFGCPLDDTSGRTLTVERFEVSNQVLEVLSSLYLFDNYDWFTVRPDCGGLGYIKPLRVSYNADSQATLYPNVFAEVLAPGVYTRVSCEVDLTEEQTPIPTQPANIDCAHAVPLPSGRQNAYVEERILDEPALFYSLSLTEPDPGYVWELEVNGFAVESSAAPVVKLHGVSTAFEEESQMPGLNAGHPALFSPPAGSYCVEVRGVRGVKYSIFYDAYQSLE